MDVVWWMELVVPEGFPDPEEPVIPFRVRGWWPWCCWVVLVVPEGFPDPKDPVIPFRVSGWCLWW